MHEEQSLDLSPELLSKYLKNAVQMVARLYANLEDQKVFQSNSVDEVRALFDESLPETGSDLDSLMHQIEKDVFPHTTRNIGPNFYGYVMSCGNHAGIIAELLSAALDQNPAKWHLGPAATEIERRIIAWVAEFLRYPQDTEGILVSGGSAANLTCLKAARDYQASFDIRQRGIHGGPQLTMYISKEGHSCLDKSVDMLGIGKEHLRKVPVNQDFTIDLQILEQMIVADREAGYHPACIIANAGTVATGAVDPMNRLADIAARYNMWLHVDAAYGGPAASTALAGELFAGMERADSVATDAHKWLYVPYEVGIALVRNQKALREAFSVLPDYLKSDNSQGRHDPTEYHFQLSRNFKALRVWMTFKAYGAQKLRSAIEHNIRTVQHLVSLINSSEDFEMLAPAPLSIACFRYKTRDRNRWNESDYLDALNRNILREAERDGRVFLSGTIINGRKALRACCVNHRTDFRHVEKLLAVLREIGCNESKQFGDPG